MQIVIYKKKQPKTSINTNKNAEKKPCIIFAMNHKHLFCNKYQLIIN